METKLDKDKEREKLVYDFIMSQVLSDPEFRNDPLKYMSDLFDYRGAIEFFTIIPFDPAELILNAVLKENKEEFMLLVAKAQDEGLKVPEGSKPYSINWK